MPVYCNHDTILTLQMAEFLDWIKKRTDKQPKNSPIFLIQNGIKNGILINNRETGEFIARYKKGVW